jgi:hypothetical protein
MPTNKRAVITTLAECMAWMAPYAGGSVPAAGTADYNDWRRWIQLGQQDGANRGFWRRFLIPETVTITKDVDYIDLPDTFGKVNGIYVLSVDGVDWARPNNSAGQRLWVYMNPTDATWRCKFVGFTPTATQTAALWHFYNPPLPQDEDDPLYLDGEMIGFYALKEKFRKDRQFGSLDDARIEYENRREELLALEVLPSPQELVSWGSYAGHLNQNPHERGYYGGRGRSRS